jgi:predicted O-linked N-acetylglucosamine transferase (SPINDLY family)
MASKSDILKNYDNILKKVNDNISKSIDSNNINDIQKYRNNAIELLCEFVECLEITDYLLIDSKPEISEKIYFDSYFTLGTLYKSFVETEIQNEINLLRQNAVNRSDQSITLSHEHETLFRRAIECFNMILRVRFENDLALKQITSIYTQICFFAQNNTQTCLQYMQEALLYTPDNPTIHYNLGYIYQRMNRLELSLIHYKISLSTIKETPESKEECRQLRLNNYNGISCIYRSIKQWPEALHYLLRAEKIDKTDPDIQNQLGVVYTEMRRTDLAEIAYNTAIKNYERAFISTDKTFFLSELYLNLGHMHSYNGDNEKSINSYNRALQVCPKFALPFQNKIMNLSYLFDQLDDKMYITQQHKLINKLYKKGNRKYKFDKDFFKSEKINIGIISGDFVDHPVSFFISTFLKHFDSERFNVTCYSECIINTKLFNQKLQFKTIKNLSAENASDLIWSDRIHILFDLAGHTAFNRIDIFALKPSPIQISYIGYPFSTGLDEMDYRITDNICDGDLSVSQKFYTEKLLPLKNCFLCYDPTIIKNGIDQEQQTHDILLRDRDGFINIGCFNRVNKITEPVVKLFNNILLKFPKTRLILKTKALINTNVQKEFINKFDKSVRNRIRVLDCTISHDDHLLTYNQVDVAIDTFPYSGTTTTCEALYMGVPVFSLWDREHWFHPQNVTISILKNSELDFYVCNNNQEIFDKITELTQKDDYFWKVLKTQTRSKFTNGLVCNKNEYMNNFQEMLTTLYKNYFN